ncbi:hypothetical protein ACWJJH_06530 [Endozoicomonadaceae bacterium StTr2]
MLKRIKILFLSTLLITTFASKTSGEIVFDVFYKVSQVSVIPASNIGRMHVNLTAKAITLYFCPKDKAAFPSRYSHRPFLCLTALVESNTPLPSLTYSVVVSNAESKHHSTVSSSIHYRWQGYIDTVNTYKTSGMYTHEATTHYYANQNGKPHFYTQEQMEYIDFWVLMRLLLESPDSSSHEKFTNYHLRSPVLIHSGIATESNTETCIIDGIQASSKGVTIELQEKLPEGASRLRERYTVFLKFSDEASAKAHDWGQKLESVQIQKSGAHSITLQHMRRS